MSGAQRNERESPRRRYQTVAKTFGAKSGCCNICGASGNLTEDHVPPQGSTDTQSKKVRVMSLPDTLSLPSNVVTRLSQNGVKFRSLCDKCNSERLGLRYDPILNRLSRKVAQVLGANGRIHLPPTVSIETVPQRLARAVVGHLLASEIRDDMTCPPRSAPLLDAMRSYFLDESLDLPPELRLHYWPCPTRWQAILRGISVSRVVGPPPHDHAIGDFLKFFPVAFWLTYDAPRTAHVGRGIREIPVRGHAFDGMVTIPVDTDGARVQRADWPERVGDNEMMLLHDAVCYMAQEV